MDETEGKLIDINASSFLKKLDTLKISHHQVHQKDKIFVFGGSIFRLRDEDGRYYLTYKGPIKLIGGLSSREKIEIEVSDPWKIQKILLILGVNVSSPKIREKRVKKFKVGKTRCNLVFCEGFKPYLEIKGAVKNIKEACNILMIDFTKLISSHPKNI